MTRYPPATLPWLRAVLLSGGGALNSATDAIYLLPDISDQLTCFGLLRSVQHYLATCILVAYRAERSLHTQGLLAPHNPVAPQRPAFRQMRACVRALEGGYPRAVIQIVLRMQYDRRVVPLALATLPETTEAVEATITAWVQTYFVSSDQF